VEADVLNVARLGRRISIIRAEPADANLAGMEWDEANGRSIPVYRDNIDMPDFRE
jgi:hypothetical protein